MQIEDAYFSDADYLKRLGVEVLPAVPFEEVIDWMSKALQPGAPAADFEHLRLVTPRLFETPAANTIPLFGLDEAHVAGDLRRGRRWSWCCRTKARGEDAGHRAPARALRERVVEEVRRHLAEKHSHAAGCGS